MKLRHILSLCSLTVCAAAFATPVIDQQNVADFDNGWSYIFISTANNYGETFVQSSGNISGAGFQLGTYWGSGSETFTIGVYTADPVFSGGTLLASGTGTGTAGSWVDAFWSPILVNSNATLYLTISSATDSYFATTFTDNNYSSGVIQYQGSVYDGDYYDLGFRTYSSVPDAGNTIGMMAGAILGMAALRRRFLSSRA